MTPTERGILQVTRENANKTKITNTKLLTSLSQYTNLLYRAIPFHSQSFLSLTRKINTSSSSCGDGSLAVQLERRCLDDTTSNGELGAMSREEGIDVTGALATLVDAPDNERLSTAAISGGKDTRQVGVVFARRCLDVLARVKLDNVGHDTLLRAQETHGEQDKVSREELLASLDVLHVPATGSGLGPLDADCVDAFDVATAVIDKLLGHDAVLTWVLAHVSLYFVVTVVSAENTGPLRPWVVAGTLWWRLREQLEVDH
jgi:hypothetical protein